MVISQFCLIDLIIDSSGYRQGGHLSPTGFTEHRLSTQGKCLSWLKRYLAI